MPQWKCLLSSRSKQPSVCKCLRAKLKRPKLRPVRAWTTESLLNECHPHQIPICVWSQTWIFSREKTSERKLLTADSAPLTPGMQTLSLWWQTTFPACLHSSRFLLQERQTRYIVTQKQHQGSPWCRRVLGYVREAAERHLSGLISTCQAVTTTNQME